MLEPNRVESNIVFFRLADDVRMTAQGLAEGLRKEGILVHALGAGSIRMVTHYHISDEDVTTAINSTARVMRA